MEAHNGRGRKEGAESSSRRLSKSRAFFDPARNPKQSQLEIVPTAKSSNASALTIERYSFGRTWFAWYLFFRGLFSNNFFLPTAHPNRGRRQRRGGPFSTKRTAMRKECPAVLPHQGQILGSCQQIMPFVNCPSIFFLSPSFFLHSFAFDTCTVFCFVPTAARRRKSPQRLLRKCP